MYDWNMGKMLALCLCLACLSIVGAAHAQDRWVPPPDRATDAVERRALAELVQTYDASGGRPGSVAAELSAHASFVLADDAALAFETARLPAVGARLTPAYARTLAQDVEAMSTDARRLAARYADVRRFGSAQWTVAALVREAEVYETLAHALLAVAYPDDGPQTAAALAAQDVLARQLGPRIEAFESLAIERDALAARLARRAPIDDAFSRASVHGLSRYSEEQVAQVLARAHAADPSVALAAPGELVGVARGFTFALADEIGPPLVAPEDP